MFYGRGNVRTGIYLTLSSDHRNIYRRDGDKVTKDRYEYALAASKEKSSMERRRSSASGVRV
nr:MAG TPA: hypothetical protein [Caudoviricetes sp.]